MIAPRLRGRAGPPSPTDRRPPHRGGGSSRSTCGAYARAAAALLALSGALALPATAQAAVLVSNIGQSTDTADFLRCG